MVDVTDATFESAVLARSDQVPVIVDLWAPWCGPCKTLTPILERVVASANGSVELVKVNIDENPQVAASFQVQSIPVLVANPAIVSQSLIDGQTVSGPITWTVQTLGSVKRVDFLVDGVVVGSAAAAPWSFAWNPAGLAPGVHVVAARAIAPNSSVDSTLTVVVAPSPGG